MGVFKKRGNFSARIVAAALAAVLCVSSVPCSAFAQVVSDADAQSASGAASQEARVAEGAGEDVGAVAAAGAVFDVGAGEGAGSAGIGAAGAEPSGEAVDDAGCIDAGVAPSGADEGDAGAGNASAFAASAERQPLSSASAGSSEIQDVAAQALEARTNAAVQCRDDRIALASANYDYSGMAHCWFRNDRPTDYVFTVEIDGVSYEAYCLDPALPAPANGWYTFYAT